MTNAIRLGKKTFTWSVVVMTILWSMGVAALVPTVVNAAECPTLNAGDLFKVPNNSAVYLLNADMERLYFPHSTVYQTWYEDFSGVVEIPSTCVDAYPAPSSAPFGVNYRPGSTLVKVQISPSVYVVEPGNTKSKIGSEAVAMALYGSDWASKVKDVADVFWPNYATTGDEITESMPHDGMLVKTSGSSNVYEVKDGMRYMVDGTVRNMMDVQVVSQSVMDSVSMGSGSVTAASVYADPTEGAGGVGDGGTTTTPGTGSGTLTVSLAADTPSGTYVYASQARAPFTKVNFTASGGDVVVKTMKVMRGGVGVDADFSKVNVVKPDGNLLNEAGKTLNSDHMASFSEDFTVKSGTTVSYMLVGDMAASGTIGSGNVPTLGVYSFETDATVVGLPSGGLFGNAVSTNTSVTLTAATVDGSPNVGTVTKRIGDTGVTLANLDVNVTGAQDAEVERITLYNSGTASGDDFTNLELSYSGTKVADGVWDGKYVSFDLSSCGSECDIEKSNNKTYLLTGDVVSGSTRNLNLYVKRASHVLVRDTSANAYVTVTNSTAANDNLIQVGAGNLTVSKVNNVPAGNVPEDAKNVELGSWNFKASGEPVDVTTLTFKIVGSGSTQAADFTALTLYDSNGNAIMSGVDGVGAATTGYATSTDTITVPVGDNVYVLKGTINSDPADGDTFTISVDQNADNFVATGVDSGDDLDLSTSGSDGVQEIYPGGSGDTLVSANTQTINTASLRVTTLSSPPAQTFAAGTNDVEFANIQLDATGSSEDIKVTQFILTNATDTNAQSSDVQNIRLYVDLDGDSYDGSGSATALSVTKSGLTTTHGTDESFTYNLAGSDQFVIKKGKKVLVKVHGDLVGSATSGVHNFYVNAANQVAAIGVDTNNTVVEVIDSATGNSMTVGSAGGQLAVALDNSNPSAKLFAGGTQGATLAVFNFLATTTEDVEMERIKFTQVVTDTASSSYLDYDLLYLENEAGVTVGSVVPTSTTPVIEFGDKAFVVDKDDTDGVRMYLKANLSAIGSGQNVSVGGHQVGFKINATGDVVAKGDQTGTGSTEFFGATTPTGNTNYMFDALPTVTKLAAGSTLSNGTSDLYKFKVTANTGDIDLYKFTFDITTTTANVTNLELVDITESQEVSLYNVSTGSQTSNITYVSVLFDDDNPTAGDGGEARTVAVGTPRTYVLRGTVTGAASGASVSTRMGGDATAWDSGANTTLMDTADTIDSDLHDDFIWSDRHLSGHTTSTNDWTNGYLVSGLTSASSTPTVLSL